MTSNVNTQCCRTSDGGNVGEWHFPNGTMVPRNSAAVLADLDFTRSGFTHQVRLNRRNNVMSPTGIYECRVHDSGEATASNETAQITVGEQRVSLLACICMTTNNIFMHTSSYSARSSSSL